MHYHPQFINFWSAGRARLNQDKVWEPKEGAGCMRDVCVPDEPLMLGKPVKPKTTLFASWTEAHLCLSPAAQAVRCLLTKDNSTALVSDNNRLKTPQKGDATTKGILPRPVPTFSEENREPIPGSLLADLQQFFTGKLYVLVYQLKLPAEELLWLALSWHVSTERCRCGGNSVKQPAHVNCLSLAIRTSQA
ncbi:unnamed protein product [Leuciscus chuanchicus]